MFGNVLPRKCDLRVHEYETYRAYYCGLCKTLKNRFSLASSAFISNDCTFLYLLSDSILNETNIYAPCRCVFHPIEKKAEILTEAAEYAACVNVMLAYAKIKDDVLDGKRTRVFLEPALSLPFRKAKALYPQAAEAIALMTASLLEIESRRSDKLDEAANAFAVMLGKLFEKLDDAQWEALYDLGYNMGRWLYLADALEDMDKDRESGNYNVFVERFRSPEETRREAEFNLMISLAQAARAYQLLSIKKNKGILDNIIYLGLKEKTNTLLKGKTVESI